MAGYQVIRFNQVEGINAAQPGQSTFAWPSVRQLPWHLTNPAYPRVNVTTVLVLLAGWASGRALAKRALLALVNIWP